jgi:hypothetical protein
LTIYKYQPDNPLANERGFVTLEDYYAYKYAFSEDKRAVIGNRTVEIRFISDTMEPTRHMCNGRYYTSKKKFRDETRARGCVEVGDQVQHLTKRRAALKLDRRQRRDDIKKAIYEIKNGRDIKKELAALPKGD